jgi:uncharacterized membrane protein YccC
MIALTRLSRTFLQRGLSVGYNFLGSGGCVDDAMSTPFVLALIDSTSKRPLLPVDAARLKRSLQLLLGFLLGCVVAAAAVSTLGDWTWFLPLLLAGVAIAV